MGKKLVYAATPQRKSSILSYGELAAAGFFSAVPTTLVAAPVERVKVLLQVSSNFTKLGGSRKKTDPTLISSSLSLFRRSLL